MAKEIPSSGTGLIGQPPLAAVSANRSDPVWERAERLAAEARWLTSKCGLLRDACRTMLAAAPKAFPLTSRQSEWLAMPGQSPIQLLEAMHESLTSSAPRPANLTNEEIESAAATSAQLVSELSVQRAELRTLYLSLFEELYPSDPLTEEDIRRLMTEPIGPSIEQIVEEFERETAP